MFKGEVEIAKNDNFFKFCSKDTQKNTSKSRSKAVGQGTVVLLEDGRYWNMSVCDWLDQTEDNGLMMKEREKIIAEVKS